MKYEFKYQCYWLKVLFCGLFIAIWIVIQIAIKDLFPNEWIYWFFGGVMTVSISVLCFSVAKKMKCFEKTGTFTKTDDGYKLIMKREIAFKNVNRICAWKADVFGMNVWFLQIEAEKRIKIVSVPLTDEQTFVNVSLFPIWNQIVKDNKNLVQEKDDNGEGMPYDYSVKKK